MDKKNKKGYNAIYQKKYYDSGKKKKYLQKYYLRKKEKEEDLAYEKEKDIFKGHPLYLII
jgi:hypothetical protein